MRSICPKQHNVFSIAQKRIIRVAEIPAYSFGANLRNARLGAGLSQSQLAKAARVPRHRLIRVEQDNSVLNLAEATQIATVLKMPLQRLATGLWGSGSDLGSIAFELYHLGIRDLEVSAPRVPGAFRVAEQVVALALRGDQPEPRVIEAIPFVLARKKLQVSLTIAFAARYDQRIRTRLAWLSDITITLAKLSRFPIQIMNPEQLRRFVQRGVRPSHPDSLGHPCENKSPPIWERWNITYAGDMSDFMRRILAVEYAYRNSIHSLDSGE
jgi:transcriptional regulator with XRE-family HTH domain